jgi:DNA-binding NtrC family response regulator
VTDGAELQLIEFPTVVELIGGSPSVQRARTSVKRAANGDDAVLLAAEQGLDAAAVARVIHEGSSRSIAPLVTIDCAADEYAALEHHIFASPALEGTVLLSNVQELPAPLQARLARALRDGQVELNGYGSGVAFNVRIIASASVGVEEGPQQGGLRPELGARFKQRIDVPPLRHRPADIPTLIGCLVPESATAGRVPVPTFTREALTLLSALPWRRNFDELREVLDVLVLAAIGGAVGLADVLDHIPVQPMTVGQVSTTSLREARLTFERHYIAVVLNRHHGRIADAARSLGIQRTNLYRKVRQLGIGLTRAK